MGKILIKNGLVYIDRKFKKLNIFIEGDIISKIIELHEFKAEEYKDCTVIDATDKIVCPGFVDSHCHLREPGFEYKETVKTGTASAAKGGFTTVMPMPNTKPILDSLDNLNKFKDIVKKDSLINVFPYSSVTVGEKGEELVDVNELSKEGVLYFSDDGVSVSSSKMMYLAMEKICEVSGIIASHCEDNDLKFNGSLHRGSASERLSVKGILSCCESVHIARDILIALETKCKYHVCHISTKEGVHLVRLFKKLGANITAEVTPHHLVLCDDDILDSDSNFKMNPPLRSRDDREELIKGLIDGTIDIIGTDHAPHSFEEKNKDIERAPFGIVGFETAFPILYTNLVCKNIISLEDLIYKMSERVCEIFKINDRGVIFEGFKGDITIIDLNSEYRVDSNKFLCKSKNTPFNNVLVKGKIVRTICNGKEVYIEDEK